MKFEKFKNSNGNVYSVIDRSDSGNYTLLSSEKNLATPYVIAWRCPKVEGSWGQGHYYCTMRAVMTDWLGEYAYK